MKLIVGLGNPGKEYERTRHNTGRRAVLEFHRAEGETFGNWQKKFKSLAAEGLVGKEKAVLLLPETYMNESGDAVVEAATFYKLAPADILVVSDDLALSLGHQRFRPSGSDGGQRGLRHIIQRLGTENVPRLRLGIATEKIGLVPAEVYVLERFSKDEEKLLADTLQLAGEAIGCWIAEGIDEAMNRYNREH